MPGHGARCRIFLLHTPPFLRAFPLVIHSPTSHPLIFIFHSSSLGRYCFCGVSFCIFAFCILFGSAIYHILTLIHFDVSFITTYRHFHLSLVFAFIIMTLIRACYKLISHPHSSLSFIFHRQSSPRTEYLL